MLDLLTVSALKKIIREYNLHTVIKGYSVMSKTKLIEEIKKRLHYEDGKLVINSNDLSIEVPKMKKKATKKKATKKAPAKKAPAKKAPAKKATKKATKKVKKVEYSSEEEDSESSEEDSSEEEYSEEEPKKVMKKAAPKAKKVVTFEERKATLRSSSKKTKK
jgi:hypothetical protein